MHDKKRRYGLTRLGCNRGFTLVEVVVVIGIMAVLLSLATLYFKNLNDKYHIEQQVKQMQSDFEHLRLRAITTKQPYGLVLTQNSYSFVRYANDDDVTGTQYASYGTTYPMQLFSAGSYSTLDTTVRFDERGCMVNPAAPLSIAVAPGVSGPAVNGLLLQTAKSNIGQIQGATCVLQ